MIDWNAPLETTPDTRNPEPVPCEVVHSDHGYEVRINSDWFMSCGSNLGNDVWWYRADGTTNTFLPVLRNVQP